MKKHVLDLLQKSAAKVYRDKDFGERPVSATVGRVLGLPAAAILGTTAPLRKGMTQEKILAMLKDMPDELDSTDSFGGQELAIYPNSTRPIEDIKRAFKRKDISALGKVLSVLQLPQKAVAALTRSDHYDPMSNSITMYNDDPAILAHELGHARDFSKVKYPTLYTLSRGLGLPLLVQEYRASNEASKLLKAVNKSKRSRKEKELSLANAYRKLGGGFGSYLGMGPAVIAGGQITGLMLGLDEDFKKSAEDRKKAKADARKEAKKEKETEKDKPEDKLEKKASLEKVVSTGSGGKKIRRDDLKKKLQKIIQQRPFAATAVASAALGIPAMALYKYMENQSSRSPYTTILPDDEGGYTVEEAPIPR